MAGKTAGRLISFSGLVYRTGTATSEESKRLSDMSEHSVTGQQYLDDLSALLVGSRRERRRLITELGNHVEDTAGGVESDVLQTLKRLNSSADVARVWQARCARRLFRQRQHAAVVVGLCATASLLSVAQHAQGGTRSRDTSPIPAVVMAKVVRAVPEEVRYVPRWVPNGWRFLGWGFSESPGQVEFAFDRNHSFSQFPVTYEAQALPAFPVGVIVRVAVVPRGCEYKGTTFRIGGMPIGASQSSGTQVDWRCLRDQRGRLVEITAESTTTRDPLTTSARRLRGQLAEVVVHVQRK